MSRSASCSEFSVGPESGQVPRNVRSIRISLGTPARSDLRQPVVQRSSPPSRARDVPPGALFTAPRQSGRYIRYEPAQAAS
jgi:hypothetical protein